MKIHKNICYFILWSLILTFSTQLYASLLSEWTYDEPSSTQVYYDQTSNNNDLTRGETGGIDTHDPAYSTDTPHGGTGNASISLDGSSDFAWRNNTSSLKPSSNLSLASWVKLNSLSLIDQDVLISNVGVFNSSGGYQLFFASGATIPTLGAMYRPHIGGNYPDRWTGVSLSSVGFEVDTWYHVGATFSESGGNTTISIYLDGKSVTSSTHAGTISYDNTPYFFIGSNIDGEGELNFCERELNGYMDDTRIYSNDLSSGEMRTLAEIDIKWAGAVNDYASNKSRWLIPKVPGYSSNLILPDYGSPYTVYLDSSLEINDLDVGVNTTIDLDRYTLTVEKEANIDGTLKLAGAHYMGNGAVNTGLNSMITGYGIIDQSLNTNKGTIKASQGTLTIGGNVKNLGTISASKTDSLVVTGSLTNEKTGIIRSESGAYLQFNNITNWGLIEIKDGGFTGLITANDITENGILSLDKGTLRVNNLSIGKGGFIVDNNVISTIDVTGNLSKESGSSTDFDADNINVNIFNKTASIAPHNVSWGAQDMGANPLGFFNNLALYQIAFGDDIGLPGSDRFDFSSDTIMYSFGITILTDASLDLGGSILYYLRAGDIVNGITGKGFNNLGSYSNGKIIEVQVVPEPGAMMLFLTGIIIFSSIISKKK